MQLFPLLPKRLASRLYLCSSCATFPSVQPVCPAKLRKERSGVAPRTNIRAGPTHASQRLVCWDAAVGGSQERREK